MTHLLYPIPLFEAYICNGVCHLLFCSSLQVAAEVVAGVITQPRIIGLAVNFARGIMGPNVLFAPYASQTGSKENIRLQVSPTVFSC